MTIVLCVSVCVCRERERELCTLTNVYAPYVLRMFVHVYLLNIMICTHRNEDRQSAHLPRTPPSSPPGEGLNYTNASQLSNSALPHTPPGNAFEFFFFNYEKHK